MGGHSANAYGSPGIEVEHFRLGIQHKHLQGRKSAR